MKDAARYLRTDNELNGVERSNLRKYKSNATILQNYVSQIRDRARVIK